MKIKRNKCIEKASLIHCMETALNFWFSLLFFFFYHFFPQYISYFPLSSYMVTNCPYPVALWRLQNLFLSYGTQALMNFLKDTWYNNKNSFIKNKNFSLKKKKKAEMEPEISQSFVTRGINHFSCQSTVYFELSQNHTISELKGNHKAH